MSYRQAKHDEPLIYELTCDSPQDVQIPADLLPEGLARKEIPNIPGLCERDLVRQALRRAGGNQTIHSVHVP